MSSVVGILRLGIYFIMVIMVLLLGLYFHFILSNKNKKGTSVEIKFNSENFSSEKEEDNDPIKNL